MPHQPIKLTAYCPPGVEIPEEVRAEEEGGGGVGDPGAAEEA